jgi:uncharacterized protein (TIGR02145 family)
MKFYTILTRLKTPIKILAVLLMILIISYSCKKETTEEPVIQTDSVTDIDGNVYKTVKIGDQWWMAENLRVKRYRDGDSIVFVGTKKYSYNFDSAKWNNTKLGAYCLGRPWKVNADSVKKLNQIDFGFLYNRYALNDSQRIAPVGWHIPSDEEWKQLEITLGMSKTDADMTGFRGSNQANKMKHFSDDGTDYWLEPSEDNKYIAWGTNESGFSALPGGCMMFYGKPEANYNNTTGFWWSSTSFSDTETWYRHLDYEKPNVFRFHGSNNYGFSIRCVKD